MVRIGILGICVTSSVIRVLLSGFWVSESQVAIPRDPVPGSWVSGSHVPGSWVSGSQIPRVPGLRVPGLTVPGLSGLRSQGPGPQGLRTRVPGLRS